MKHLGHSQSSQTKQKKPDPPRTHVDLFSGIGGFALGARWAGVQTVAFCDTDEYAKKVLRKNFEGVPVFHDVRDFPSDEFSRPWILTGGYPCQPFSQAGKRRGTEDDRHLWPEMFRIIRSSRPVWVLCENVAGHITMGLDEVISDLEGEEYSVQSFVIPALSVDAKHRRDRVWIVADTDNARFKERRRSESVRSEHHSLECSCEDLADSLCYSQRSAHWRESRTSQREWEDPNISEGNQVWSNTSDCGGFWLPEPDVGRVAHGVSNRVDRLKGLGNAIVPQVAYQIIRTMIESEEQFIGEQHENQS